MSSTTAGNLDMEEASNTSNTNTNTSNNNNNTDSNNNSIRSAATPNTQTHPVDLEINTGNNHLGSSRPKIVSPPPSAIRTPFQLQIFKIIYLTLSSFIFGFLLEKSKVFAPEVIQGQMTLHNWRMMKFFLAFVGCAQFILGLFALADRHGLWWFNRFSNRIHHLRERNVDDLMHNGPFKEFRGPFPIVIGSIILGVGMATAGACPGTIYAQAGAGLVSGGWALFGGVVGALIFAIMQSALTNTPFWTLGQRFFVKHYGLGGQLYSLLAILFGMVSIGLSVMLHFVATSDNGFDYFMSTGVRTASSNVLLMDAWHPIICGAIASVLVFFPNVLLMNMTCGYSMTYPAFLAPFLSFEPLNDTLFFDSPHDIKDMKFPSFVWLRKLVPAIGVFLGALTSAFFSRQFARYFDFSNVPRGDIELLLWSDHQAVRILQPIIGGMLVVFGARMAGGCTSGHGISGMTLLRSPSILLAIPAMFFGGIITGVAMKLGITGQWF